jgi:hypothetical protein
MREIFYQTGLIPIPFSDVMGQFTAFLSSPVVGGVAALILGIGAGGFALYKLRKGLADGG